jgi:hypothetical protein
VQIQSTLGHPVERVNCWAELLPLRISDRPFSGSILLVGPAREAPKLVARLRRAAGHSPGVLLRDEQNDRNTWVVTQGTAQTFGVSAAYEHVFELFAEQAPSVWGRSGWDHPLPDHLVTPGDSILLLRPPRGVEIAPGKPPTPVVEDYHLSVCKRAFHRIPSPPGRLTVELGLRARKTSEKESLWILSGEDAAGFWKTCAGVDERLLRKLEIAVAKLGQEERVILRCPGRNPADVFLPAQATGYVADPRLPGLFVPALKELRPHLRLAEMTAALQLKPDQIIWLEVRTDGAVVPRSIGRAEFKPLAQLVDYTSPARARLVAEPRVAPFPLQRFVHLESNHKTSTEPIVSPQEVEEAPEEAVSGVAGHGWFTKVFSRLFSKSRHAMTDPATSGPGDEYTLDESDLIRDPEPADGSEPGGRQTGVSGADTSGPPRPAGGWFAKLLKRGPAVDDRIGDEATDAADSAAPEPAELSAVEHRVQKTLSSQDALRHGPHWATRRTELEAALLKSQPHQDAESRARQWTTLAHLYTKLGNNGDAAVCWMNAIWENPTPPLPWLQEWLLAECRNAKLSEARCVLERWLSERQPGIARVVAAYTAVAGHTQSVAELLPTLPRIFAFLDQHFDDVPVRSAWLAKHSATRVCDGDALGLARWRDRLLTRLAEKGPGLDLDEPSFLRFQGAVSGERFQAARRRLESMREKVREWIQRHGRAGGRPQSDRLLQWAGLSAERDATAAYADFMLAWGLACLGERLQANNWVAQGRKRLAATSSPGVDPAVPAALGELFVYRVREAQEGRVSKAYLPADLQLRLEALPDLARFSVDRLREHSRILEPRDTIRAFRGRDLKDVWGTDRLAERLSLIAERTDPALLSEEAEGLVRLCMTSPSTSTVPRIILTLLEVAPRLADEMQLRVLDHLPTAVDWLEPWLATGRWHLSERQERLTRYRTRMIRAGFSAAALLGPDQARPLLDRLVRRLVQQGDPVREPFIGSATPVFRALKRHGMRGEAESLVSFLGFEYARGDRQRIAAPLARLGLSVGLFTAGNEQAGYQIVNQTSELLYLDKTLSIDEQTSLAIAYAEALGFAPPGIALGRLGELFERLDCVRETGSTNRYFTLKPLQLVDAAVRSVVTDEFAPGPDVKGWLDDDEFLIRSRIHRDLAAVLRDQGVS